MGLYRQMIGRIRRPAEDKLNAIVLDHSGAVFRHGFVEDRVEWTLDPDRRAEAPAHTARVREGYTSRLIHCTECDALRIAGEPCRACGFMPQRPPEAVVFRDGDLARVDRDGHCHANPNPDEMVRWHCMLAYIAAERGYKPGWAGHKFKDKFGVWPATKYPPLIAPSPEVLAWVRSRAIAYAKAKAKERAA